MIIALARLGRSTNNMIDLSD
ncbi:hypothetical protein [Arthrobacter sp. AFG20]